jgi:hypothetical protein
MHNMMVKVSRHVVSVQDVVDAHWKGLDLFVNFRGGGFARFTGNDAKLLFALLESMAVDLDTGEVGAAVANVAAS